MFLSGKESNLNLNMFKYINILWRSSFSSLLCLLFGCVCFPLQASLFYFSPSFLQTPLCCFHRGVVVLKNLKNSKFTSLRVKAHPGKKEKRKRKDGMWWERRERAGCSSCCFFSSKKKNKKIYQWESRSVFSAAGGFLASKKLLRKKKRGGEEEKKSARVKVCDSETRKPTQAEIDDSKSILCSISRSVFCLEFTRVCSSVSSLRRA